ncbi:MAG: hypothetical protein ABSC29_00295 [Minisyncoccia bacterium]|jgi:hypothetical protein
MALPQQVIDRLTREPPETPGWSLGLLTFSCGILAIALAVYFGLTFGYEPYLDAQTAQLSTQINTLTKSISSDDRAKFITFYSEIVNVKTAVANHVVFSRFLSWLEKNTEANVYYSHLAFSAGNKIALSGAAKTEADVNQQAAIFEAAPEVRAVDLSSVVLSATGGQWQFNMILTMDPSLTLRQSP